MKRLAFGLVFVGLVHVAGSVVEGQSRCTFPSENQHCVSPGDRWEVEWQAPSGDGRHVLWLKDFSSGIRTELAEFDRSVELLWSPDGRALAVTDHTASNESVIWVFTGPKLLPGVNVEDRLRASLGRVPEIFKNGHRYFEALDWSSSDLLRFRVRAYDSQPGKEYNRSFLYHMSGGVSRERSK